MKSGRDWKNLIKQGLQRITSESVQRNSLEASFLAPVLEIQEKPPSPTARITAMTLVLLVFLAVLWACVSEVDIVVVGKGKIIPDQRTKVVQAAVGGAVTRILVSNGDVVSKDQPLFLINPTSIGASLEQALKHQRSARLDRAMHSLLVRADATDAETVLALADLHELSGLPPERIKRQQELLDETYETHRNSLSGVLLEISTLRQQRKIELKTVANTEQTILSQEELSRIQQETISNEIKPLRKLLPLAKTEYASLQKLNGNQVVSRLQVNRAEEKYTTLSGDLTNRKDRLNEMRVAAKLRRLELEQKLNHHQHKAEEIAIAIRGREQVLKGMRSEFRKSHADAREQSLRELESLEQEIVKLEQERKSHTVLSPTDGVVQQLVLHTVGGVVQPSQELLVVVPKNPVLRVEALIENKDIGFVEPGLPVEIKVDAFPYTKYGLAKGEILYISPDAVQDEQLGLAYIAYIALEETLVGKDGEVNLTTGMGVTAEIRLGKRRIIEYILTPFLETGQESMRER